MTFHEPISPDRGYLSELAKTIDEPGVFGKLILWIKLSSGRIPGFKFIHDHSIAGYTIDFYCPSIKLGIDVGIAGKEGSRITDTTRTSALEAHGIMLLNFTDEEINLYTEDVVEHIRILATAFGRISATG